jgi:hypothetical protein
MGKRLEAALDELRAAVFEAYAALAEEGAKTGTEQRGVKARCNLSTRSWSRARWLRSRPRISNCSKCCSLIGARPRWQRMLQSELRCQIRSSSGQEVKTWLTANVSYFAQTPNG